MTLHLNKAMPDFELMTESFVCYSILYGHKRAFCVMGGGARCVPPWQHCAPLKNTFNGKNIDTLFNCTSI